MDYASYILQDLVIDAMGNIKYNNSSIEGYFSKTRINWDQFYISEKKIISSIFLNQATSVLDIGCGCGGLGLALREKFGVLKYFGVDINYQAIETARQLYPEALFQCGDILDVATEDMGQKKHDVVFSLSCIDWNIEFNKMLKTAFQFVNPGGHLILTIRLTSGTSTNNIEKSFQSIGEGPNAERAPYIVFNVADFFNLIAELNLKSVHAVGYFCKPSDSAVTPYDELCMTAFSFCKRTSDDESAPTYYDLDLPDPILAQLEF